MSASLPTALVDEDKTVIEESCLGPTQPYPSSPAPLLPRYIRTPSPKTKLLRPPPSTASSDRYYVDSVVSENEDDELDYERQKVWWGAWRRDGLLQLDGKIKVLVKEKQSLEGLEFPAYEEWCRNRELVSAAERGLQKYNNGDAFQNIDNQLIGRELSNVISKVVAVATQHPATRVVRVSPSKRREPYR